MQRKVAKAAGEELAANSFAVIAEGWLAKQTARMAPATMEKARWTLHDLVNPWIGNRPISGIDAPEMLKLLRRIEDRGAHETVHRTKQRCGQIFRYAIATGRAKHDPTADLRGALTPAWPWVCMEHADMRNTGILVTITAANDPTICSLNPRQAKALSSIRFICASDVEGC
ncbi:MAG TPA: hypothetical protein VME63_03195 [Dyella sp.]|uniref:tyrosine-type recombinase/integrase n=1 Tax=Dyella sp. TaxID=1869338 RepID=UPI002B923ACF|nr:hypothetical protein [Dyella sp.]HTV84381.1 hypothetical protein [Dyella sp.]